MGWRRYPLPTARDSGGALRDDLIWWGGGAAAQPRLRKDMKWTKWDMKLQNFSFLTCYLGFEEMGPGKFCRLGRWWAAGLLLLCFPGVGGGIYNMT